MATPLSVNAAKGLQFSAHRIVSASMRDTLSMMETLQDEHDECMRKLASALPPEYLTYLPLADYFTPDRADRLRRAILGRGNDCSRAIQDEIAKYGISLTSSQPPAAPRAQDEATPSQ